MPDKLAGRLTWERTGQGSRFEIPARLGWLALFLTAWLAFWLFGGIQAIRTVLNGDDKSSFLLIWLVGWAAGVCIVGGTLVWSLGGRTTLILDPSEIRIQRRVFGLELDTRTFLTSHVENLRYIPRYYSGGSRGGGYNQSQMRFEADGKTRKFASGVSDIEAFALIDRMLEIYNFPKSRALEYVGKP